MNRLAEVIDRPEPAMAVVFRGGEPDELIEDVAALGAVAEFRADLAPEDDLSYLVKQAKRLAQLPLLLTVRIPEEKGKWQRSEADRYWLIGNLLPYVDAVDVEVARQDTLELVVEDAHTVDKVVIASAHNFLTTPPEEDLQSILKTATNTNATYLKVATSTSNEEEFDTLKEFGSKDRKIITVPMGVGKAAKNRRINVGSPLVYASTGTASVAPGQMNYRETHKRLMKQYPDYAALFN